MTGGARAMNHLHYGYNLSVLRESIADDSVDLIYLDPPFNSNASYNVLFKEPSGSDSAAQIEAFDAASRWTSAAEAAFHEVGRSNARREIEVLGSFNVQQSIKRNLRRLTGKWPTPECLGDQQRKALARRILVFAFNKVQSLTERSVRIAPTARCDFAP